MITSEVLEQFGQVVSLEQLTTASLMWSIGPECGHTEQLFSAQKNKPCAICGVNVVRRRLLFSSEEEILTALYGCYVGKHTRAVTLLLFGSLLEHHVQRLLEAICSKAGLTLNETKLVTKRARFLEERLAVLEEMIAGFDSEKAMAPLAQAYQKFKEDRNGLAHGRPWAHLKASPEDCITAVNLAGETFNVSARLLGKHCCTQAPTPQRPSNLK